MGKRSKRPGRKPKPKEMKRSIRKELCFTEREWELIVDAAGVASLEPGVFAREAVIEKIIRQHQGGA